MSEDVVGGIERYLAAQASRRDEEQLIQNGVFLVILVKRHITTRSQSVRIRPSDRDAFRLLQFLVEPGLAPGLATVTRRNRRFFGPILIISPNWERIAGFFGKNVAEFEIVLRHRLPLLVRRHRDTFDYLLNRY